MSYSDPKATERFRSWMETRYPKIWASHLETELGDNELWLYGAVREAYYEAYTQGVADAAAAASAESENKGEPQNGQQRVQQAPAQHEATIEQRVGEFNPNHGLEWP